MSMFTLRLFFTSPAMGMLLSLLLLLSTDTAAFAEIGARAGLDSELLMPAIASANSAPVWRYITLFCATVLLYSGTLYAASGARRSKQKLPPAPPRSHNIRDPLAALLVCVAVDAAVFHTGLYDRIIETKSVGGTVAVHAREEKGRASSGLQEIIALGDSRMGEAFSSKLANKLAAAADAQFLNLAIPDSRPRLWFYLLREIDPSAKRYRAIVLPLKFDNINAIGEPIDPDRDIRMTAPLLRYSDAWQFGSSFREWRNQFRAFMACWLRGSAYRADIFDLLEHPIKRVETIRSRSSYLEAEYNYPGRDRDLTGLSYDPSTEQITFPENLSPKARSNIERSIEALKQRRDRSELHHDWMDRIVSRYEGSATNLVFCPMPRGPVARFVPEARSNNITARDVVQSKRAIFLRDDLFEAIETPEFYFDGFHPNAKGRKKFTELLVADLLPKLSPDKSAAPRAKAFRPTSPTVR